MSDTSTSTVAPPFDVEWCCWAASGWEDAPEGSIRDARTTTRGQAAAFVASETTGDIREIRVWKRYILPFTREEIWQGPGRDRWADDDQMENVVQGPDGNPRPARSLAESFEAAPDLPPAGWQPTEWMPSWRFVGPSRPGAIPVWVVGFRGDDPPTSPKG